MSDNKENLHALDDSALDGVAGGVWDGNLWVQCPCCSVSDAGFFLPYGKKVDSIGRSTQYHCGNCGTDFVVDHDNRQTWTYYAWVAECKKHGYNYPY